MRRENGCRRLCRSRRHAVYANRDGATMKRRRVLCRSVCRHQTAAGNPRHSRATRARPPPNPPDRSHAPRRLPPPQLRPARRPAGAQAVQQQRLSLRPRPRRTLLCPSDAIRPGCLPRASRRTCCPPPGSWRSAFPPLRLPATRPRRAPTRPHRPLRSTSSSAGPGRRVSAFFNPPLSCVCLRPR